MKIRNLSFAFLLIVLGILSCTEEQESPFDLDREAINDLELITRGDGECCDFNYDIISQNVSGACCFYQLSITNTGDCSITISDTKDIITIDPGLTTVLYYKACDNDGDGSVILNVSATGQDGEEIQCGTIPLTPDCSEPCDCEVSIVKNECILSAEIGDNCQGPFTYTWTYPGGVTSNYVGDITALYTGEYCLSIVDANGCEAEDCIFIDDCEDPEPECEEDCMINLKLEDTGNDVQFARLIQIGDDCEEHNFFQFLHGVGLVYHNDSNCNAQEALDLWNGYNTSNYIYLINLEPYSNNVEQIIQARKGCEDALVNVFINNQGELEYEISYDCATCEIYFIRPVGAGFDVNEDCTDMDLPPAQVSDGGFTECGACE